MQRFLTTRRTNSKATIRLAMKDLLPLMPPILRASITGSRHYAAKSDALVFQADSSRKQGDNVEECFRNLHQLIVQTGHSVIKKEISTAQVEKVKKLYGFFSPSLTKVITVH